MRFEIKEVAPVPFKEMGWQACGMMPLVEDAECDINNIGGYGEHLNRVIGNGMINSPTVIGSGVCIVATDEQGKVDISDIKSMSQVFRQALKMAIKREDPYSAYFQAILDDYEKNGICLPMHASFFEDEEVQEDEYKLTLSKKTVDEILNGAKERTVISIGNCNKSDMGLDM